MVKCPNCNHELEHIEGTVKFVAQIEESKEFPCEGCEKCVYWQYGKCTFYDGPKNEKIAKKEGKCEFCYY